MSPEPAKLHVTVDECGHGTVTLNGVDLSAFMVGIEFKSAAQEPTEVRLTLYADVSAEVKVMLDRLAIRKVDDEVSQGQGVRLLSGKTIYPRKRA